MSMEWYRAVCPTCKEFHSVFVVTNYHTKLAFNSKPFNAKTQEAGEILYSWLSTAFFNKHYGCELHLSWRDDQNDKLWDMEGGKQIEFNHMSFEEFREYVIKNGLMMSEEVFDEFAFDNLDVEELTKPKI